jgi:flagellar biosynthetic protein FliQ
MDSQQVFTFGQQGMMMLLMISAPVLIVVLVVGLLVSIFQAATQIHETTLSFVPKIVAAVGVMVFAGPWMVTTLVEYLQRTLQSIPSIVG